MPELPEVEALALFLAKCCVGRTVARSELAAFACLKSTNLPSAASSRRRCPACSARFPR